jgi:hypothetical protein
MSRLRKRFYLNETSMSKAVPGIVKPFVSIRRRAWPRLVSVAVDRLDKATLRLRRTPSKKRRNRKQNSLLRGIL